MANGERKHTISVLVENKFGVLARIAGLFSGRGYNIDSLTVAPTENTGVSRMTITVKGDDSILEQINKQLNKLINVIKVSDITSDEHVERELALIKVSADRQSRLEIIQIVDVFRCRVIDIAPSSLVVEVTGDSQKIDAIVDLLRPYGIIELVRTGKAAITRG